MRLPQLCCSPRLFDLLLGDVIYVTAFRVFLLSDQEVPVLAVVSVRLYVHHEVWPLQTSCWQGSLMAWLPADGVPLNRLGEAHLQVLVRSLLGRITTTCSSCGERRGSESDLQHAVLLQGVTWASLGRLR